MKLSSEDEARMLAHSYTCSACGREIGKGYCGRCDEFYSVGHAPGCSVRASALRDDHSACARRP